MKKINGRKRHLVTDILGLTLACHWIKRRFTWLTCRFADAGNQGQIAASNATSAGLRLEIVKRSPHALGFEVIPRRWVIEQPCMLFLLGNT